jgi:hypothetical protein
MIKRFFSYFISSFILIHTGTCQEPGNPVSRISFQGLVMDAHTLSPIAYSQIMINRTFSSVSGSDGTFSFYVNRKDTVLFKSLGYKSTMLIVSDTLIGRDFIAGIYMKSDTLLIGEVVVIPRLSNLKSEILNARSKTPSTFENARYNVAVSAYQGRNSMRQLGDPADNYTVLSDQQKVSAYERGGIPSDKIVGLSPLLLIPAAYLLIKGMPEKPAPVKQKLTGREMDQIQKKYLEQLKERK